jgi:hypothetical protein
MAGAGHIAEIARAIAPRYIQGATQRDCQMAIAEPAPQFQAYGQPHMANTWFACSVPRHTVAECTVYREPFGMET